jgi:hypothetical protein
MQPEPKKPIEELLEASAKARRAEFGADPKMPNPMRARLHDEITRAAREEEPKARRSWNWFAMPWPIGTVAAAVVIAAFVMWRSHELQPQRESRQLATNEPRAANEALPPAAPQLPAKSADSSRENAAPAQHEETKVLNNAGSIAADIAKADDEKSNAMKKFADVAIASTEKTPSASQSGAAAASAPALLAQNEKAETNINQQFSQSLSRARLRGSKLKPANNVLNTFQIQQKGNQIRVVDADGSTYTGTIEPITQSSVRRALKDKEAQSYATRSERAASQQTAPPDNEFYFRATGYSSSLKKPVVFEGNYVGAQLQSKAASEAIAEDAEQMPARIVGTATIHGESPIEVDAVSVPAR